MDLSFLAHSGSGQVTFTVLWGACGYICGSIPFGYLVVRLAGLGDIRKIGSANIGATNVLRTGKPALAALTLVADALKAAAPTSLALFMAGEAAALTAALCAFCGHLFPVWLKFRGGKGIASFLGIVAVLDAMAGLVFIIVWLAMATLFRISALAGLAATCAVPIFLYSAAENAPAASIVAVMTALCWWRHRANIKRLRHGTEPRITVRR